MFLTKHEEQNTLEKQLLSDFLHRVKLLLVCVFLILMIDHFSSLSNHSSVYKSRDLQSEARILNFPTTWKVQARALHEQMNICFGFVVFLLVPAI